MTAATDPPVSLAAYLATKQRDKPAPTHPHTPPPPTNGTIHPIDPDNHTYPVCRRHLRAPIAPIATITHREDA